MLILRANTDDLNIVTGSTGDIEVHISAMQVDGSTPPVVQPLPNLGPLASITTATTTMVVDTSGITSGHNVNVKHLNIFNNAGTSNLVTVSISDGTNTTDLAECTLLGGEWLVLNQAGVWIHYDVNGGQYPQVGAIATQAEMEAGTSVVTTVSPGRAHFHPGANKFWVEFTGNSTTILASYNMTSITDGTTQATVTIATDFSSSTWCCQATAECGTTINVTNIRLASCSTIAAGSIIVACCDAQATSAMADPTRWHVTGLGDQ